MQPFSLFLKDVVAPTSAPEVPNAGFSPGLPGFRESA